jgi:hypothetical protein
MTYDPFQFNATLGANAGIANPFHTPFTALQTSAINPQTVNPATGWNPGIPQIVAGGQFGHPGINAFPQTALFHNPLLISGLQPGVLQNSVQNPFVQQLAVQQLAQHILSQQLAAQQIAAQQMAAQLGQQTGAQLPFGQIGLQGSPYGQNGYGQMAPQSWVGQGGVPGVAQANPVLLAQLTARAMQAQGLSPTLNPGAGFQF